MEKTKKSEKMAEYIELVSASITASIHSSEAVDGFVTHWSMQEGVSKRYIIHCEGRRLLFSVRCDGKIDAYYTEDKDNDYFTPIARFSWYLEDPEGFLTTVNEITRWILDKFCRGTLHDEINNDVACSAVLSSSAWNAKWAIPHPAGIWVNSQDSVTERPEYKYSGIFNKYEELIRIYTLGLGEKEGATLAEQTAAAVNNLIFLWEYGEEVFDNVHGWPDDNMGDISCYANWLYKYRPEAQDILNRISGCTFDFEYDELLADLAELLLVEEKLHVADRFPAKGSIYDCEGLFRCESAD